MKKTVRSLSIFVLIVSIILIIASIVLSVGGGNVMNQAIDEILLSSDLIGITQAYPGLQSVFSEYLEENVRAALLNKPLPALSDFFSNVDPLTGGLASSLIGEGVREAVVQTLSEMDLFTRTLVQAWARAGLIRTIGIIGAVAGVVGLILSALIREAKPRRRYEDDDYGYSYSSPYDDDDDDDRYSRSRYKKKKKSSAGPLILVLLLGILIGTFVALCLGFGWFGFPTL